MLGLCSRHRVIIYSSLSFVDLGILHYLFVMCFFFCLVGGGGGCGFELLKNLCSALGIWLLAEIPIMVLRVSFGMWGVGYWKRRVGGGLLV